MATHDEMHRPSPVTKPNPSSSNSPPSLSASPTSTSLLYPSVPSQGAQKYPQKAMQRHQQQQYQDKAYSSQQRHQQHQTHQQQPHDTSSTSSLPTSPSHFEPKPRLPTIQTYLATLPEWSNSNRLSSLFSDFGNLKESNPYGYSANLDWWRNALLGAARRGHLSTCQPAENTLSPPTLPGSKHGAQLESTGNAIGLLEWDLGLLENRFTKNTKRPLCLPTVLREMQALNDIVVRSEFLPMAGLGWTGWLFQTVVKAPLLWGLKQLSLSTPAMPMGSASSSPRISSGALGGSASATGTGGLGDSLGSETFVVLSMVRDAGAQVAKIQQQSVSYSVSDNLMTFSEFRDKFSRTALVSLNGRGAELVLSDRDLEIVLRYLEFELRCVVTATMEHQQDLDEPERIIKFATKDSKRNAVPLQITSVDRGIISLKETVGRLEGQIQDLENRTTEVTERIQVYLRKGQRAQARFALRSKKQLEQMTQSRMQSLESISTILFKIQSSETDAEVIQAYQIGADALGSVMMTKDPTGKVALSMDRVEATMDQLSEVFADQQEVDQAMRAGVEGVMESSSGPMVIDDDDLEQELNDLLGQTVIPEKKPTVASPQHTFKVPIPATSAVPPTSPRKDKPSRARSASVSPPRTERMTEAPILTTPVKRGAEKPETTTYKQRKLSQDSIQSQRKADAGPPSTSTSPALSLASTPELETQAQLSDDHHMAEPSTAAPQKVITPPTGIQPVPIMSDSTKNIPIVNAATMEIDSKVDPPTKETLQETTAAAPTTATPLPMAAPKPIGRLSTADENELLELEMMLDTITVPTATPQAAPAAAISQTSPSSSRPLSPPQLPRVEYRPGSPSTVSTANRRSKAPRLMATPN